jgi:hypothetical protein
MTTFKVMTREDGDKPSDFDLKTPVGLEEANKRFKELTGTGFLAWTKGADGVAKQVKALDPDIHSNTDIVFQPVRQGG